MLYWDFLAIAQSIAEMTWLTDPEPSAPNTRRLIRFALVATPER